MIESLLFLFLMPIIFIIGFSMMSGQKSSRFLSDYINFWIKLVGSIIGEILKLGYKIALGISHHLPYLLGKAMPKEKLKLGDPKDDEEETIDIEKPSFETDEEPAVYSDHQTKQESPDNYKYGEGPVYIPGDDFLEQSQPEPQQPKSNNPFQAGFDTKKKKEEDEGLDKPTDPYANPPEPEVME